MYKRVLLKLSGESLGGPAGKGIDEASLVSYASEIVEAVKAGHQIAIVNGGGNIFRGLQGVGKGFDRVNGDRMGMLATVINSLALACAIRSLGVEAEVFTATPMEPVARYYRKEDAVAVLERGGVAHSFGIHVARLAGMPREVLDAAEKTLRELEKKEKSIKAVAEKGHIEEDGSVQLSFFQLDDPTLSSLKSQLEAADLNNMTPLQAFDLLRSMKAELGV